MIKRVIYQKEYEYRISKKWYKYEDKIEYLRITNDGSESLIMYDISIKI